MTVGYWGGVMQMKLVYSSEFYLRPLIEGGEVQRVDE